MGKKWFVTCMDNGHDLCRSYIRGRISGIAYVVCKHYEDENKGIAGWSINKKSNTWKFRIDCTKEQYETFMQMVNKLYPGLCYADESVITCEEAN